MDIKTQVLAPCGSADFVCGKAFEWVSNGTELCHASGFSVSSFDDPEETSCYGERDGLDYITNLWKTSRSEVLQGDQSTGILEYMRQWTINMPVNERVSWAIGVMVLTAGILFASKRRSHDQRQKQIVIRRRAKKLGTKTNYVSPVSQENRRGTGR